MTREARAAAEVSWCVRAALIKRTSERVRFLARVVAFRVWALVQPVFSQSLPPKLPMPRQLLLGYVGSEAVEIVTLRSIEVIRKWRWEKEARA